MIELTPWARDILRRAHEAATRFNPAAKIRVQRNGSGVEAALTDDPPDTDQRIDAGGFTVYVETGLAGLIDVEEPHDRIVLRPPGSTPNPRPA